MVDLYSSEVYTAERTGKWELHLQALSEMLPYMAALATDKRTKSGLII